MHPMFEEAFKLDLNLLPRGTRRRRPSVIPTQATVSGHGCFLINSPKPIGVPYCEIYPSDTHSSLTGLNRARHRGPT